MGKLVGTGTVSGAIGGAAAVLAIAIFARTGTALEPQRTAAATPSASNASPSPQTARPAAAPAGRPAPMVDYERDIQPILSENCLECHSQDKRKGGLSLATYGDVLDGGKDGAVVRPGNSARSLMIARVKGDAGRPHAARRAAVERRADRRSCSAGSIRARGRRRPPRRRRRRGKRRSRSRRLRCLRRSGRPGAGPPIGSSPRTSRRRACRSRRWCRTRRSRDGPISTSGACCRRRTTLQAFVADAHARQARSTRRQAARRRQEVRRALDFVLERSAAQRGRPDVFLRAERTEEHHRVADGGARRATCRTTSSWRSCSIPAQPGDPEGFLIGVNWRGETSAAVMPWMQASQNTAQAFLGVNFKCNACHDSFVSKWKLKDAYGLAAYFSPEPEAAAVSLRHRARRVRASRRSSIRSSDGPRRRRR